MLKVITKINSLDHFSTWGGATKTAKRLIRIFKDTEFIEKLGEIYPNGLTDEELNTLLWKKSEGCIDLVRNKKEVEL